MRVKAEFFHFSLSFLRRGESPGDHYIHRNEEVPEYRDKSGTGSVRHDRVGFERALVVAATIPEPC